MLHHIHKQCPESILFVNKKWFMLQTISSLEKDIAGLKKEIGERDETIGDKEKRIYDLKKKNQVCLHQHPSAPGNITTMLMAAKSADALNGM